MIAWTSNKSSTSTRAANGAFRVMYVARFTHAVYVLHAFQKKTQKTAKYDLDLAAKRYKMIGTRT